MTLESWYAGSSVSHVAGFDVSFRRAGAGETLVCLHGFPTSSWDFEPIWEELSSRFDVLASDLIGLGRSEKPQRPLPVTLQADVIEGLLGSLGIERAHLLAHDLGDTVAQELLARQHEGRARVRWRSCVFLNGGLFPERHRPRLIQRLLATPLGPTIARFASARTFRRTMTRIFSSEHPPSEAFLVGSWSLLATPEARAALPRLIRYLQERHDQRARWLAPLQESQIPLRLINGVQDPVSGGHAAERYEELVPDADVVLLADAGHYPHLETPRAVLDAFFVFHERIG